MSEKEEEALLELGLSKNEAAVYLTLLRIGPSPVSTLAAEAKLYRPYVYDTLKRLMEKGLASHVTTEGMKYYSAASPHELKNHMERKMAALDGAIPGLLELSSAAKGKVDTQVFQGKRVVRIIEKDVIKTMIEKKGECLVFGVDERKFFQADSVAMNQFFEEMKRHEFRERVLVKQGEGYLPAPSATTEYRFVPKEFFSPQPTLIYGNKVAILLFSEPMHCIIIESKEVAEGYRKQFNLIWKHSRKRK